MDEVQFGEDIVDHNVWFGFYDGFTSFCFADVRKRKKGKRNYLCSFGFSGNDFCFPVMMMMGFQEV
jgi:hypothetical protein